MADTFSAQRYGSLYGTEKLQDNNYHTWSFQCQMLLSEKKVWDIVEGKTPHPKSIDEHMMEEQATMNMATKKNIEKIIIEWDEKNDEALCIISFTIVERLQDLILY